MKYIWITALLGNILIVTGFKLNNLESKGAGPAHNSFIHSRTKRQLPTKVTAGLPDTEIDGGPNVVDQNFNNLRGKGTTRYSTDMRRLVNKL